MMMNNATLLKGPYGSLRTSHTHSSPSFKQELVTDNNDMRSFEQYTRASEKQLLLQNDGNKILQRPAINNPNAFKV